MPEYMWVGVDDKNVWKDTHKANLVMCINCGFIIELIGEDRAHCSCKNYHKINGKWRSRHASS